MLYTRVADSFPGEKESSGGLGSISSYQSCGAGDAEKGEGGGVASANWRFASPGEHHGERSRDGSVHVTDEVFNSASHLIGLMFSLLGTVILVSRASAMGDPWKIVSFAIYGASLVFLFACSFLHHSIIASADTMQLLRLLDYTAIYPLIAGSFTPLCLVFYHKSTIGWSFFGVSWALGFGGMFMTIRHFKKLPKWMSMTLYIGLGWLGAFMSGKLYDKIGAQGLFWLAIGGVFYTIGGAIFSVEKPNPLPGCFGFHEIWHVSGETVQQSFHCCCKIYAILNNHR